MVRVRGHLAGPAWAPPSPAWISQQQACEMLTCAVCVKALEGAGAGALEYLPLFTSSRLPVGSSNSPAAVLGAWLFVAFFVGAAVVAVAAAAAAAVVAAENGESPGAGPGAAVHSAAKQGSHNAAELAIDCLTPCSSVAVPV